MCVCIYKRVYTYVNGCELTKAMYKHMFIFVHVFVLSMCDRMYLMQEPLFQPCKYKWRWSDKIGEVT